MLTRSIGIYAGISSGIIVLLSALIWIIMGKENYPFAVMGWGSYLILFLGHWMVFPVISAQKRELGGQMNLREALKTALLVVSLSSLAYAFYMAIFMNFMHEPFLNYFVGLQKSNLSAEEFKLFMEQLKEQAELYRSPLYHAGLAFVTSFALGFLMSLLAAWRFGR